MSITPLTFTGVSSFSNDLQTVLNRAVSIASLPAKALQNQQADLLSKKTELSGLDTAVASLASSLSALGTLGASQGLTATSSDSAKIAVNATGATSPVSYTITNITSVAAAASETSQVGYVDTGTTQVSASGTMRLVLGSNHWDITLTDGQNNLAGLAAAINKSGAPVTASVLTTGTGTTPNYLSVSANNTGETTLSLLENPTAQSPANFLTSSNQGANTRFTMVNGIQVSRPTTLINDVIPGVTFKVLGKTTDTEPSVTIGLTSDPTSISAALQDLVSSYNNVAATVASETGKGGGMLTGDALVRDVQSALRAITGYAGTGSVKSLADLGIELDVTGKMSFNQKTFNALPAASIQDAFSFLGTATRGLGGLSKSFSSLSDPISGLFKLQQDQWDTTDQQLTNQISVLTEQVNNMQLSLMTQLSSADTLLASLESQQSMLTSNIQSLNYAAYGKQAS